MTIRSRNHPFNMASWLAEKSEHICENLCAVAEKVKALPITDEQKEDLMFFLHPALYDATKIVEYAYDTDLPAWDPDVARDMLAHGNQGFKNFMAKVKEYSDMESFEPFKRE